MVDNHHFLNWRLKFYFWWSPYNFKNDHMLLTAPIVTTLRSHYVVQKMCQGSPKVVSRFKLSVIIRKSQVDSKNVSKVFPMMSQSCPNIVSKLSQSCLRIVSKLSVQWLPLILLKLLVFDACLYHLREGIQKKSFFGPKTPLLVHFSVFLKVVGRCGNNSSRWSWKV